jgi:hypothetical protein
VHSLLVVAEQLADCISQQMEALNIYFTPGKHGGDGEQAMPRDLMMAERILYEIVSKPITTNSAIICTN